MNFLTRTEFQIQPSPTYDPECNGIFERLVQEHWHTARVIIIATNIPDEL